MKYPPKAVGTELRKRTVLVSSRLAGPRILVMLFAEEYVKQ